MLQHRDEYRQSYLDQTEQRYTAVLQRNKAHLDEYKAGKRQSPPVIDYLVISGGGDIGAFGAGFLKGWSSVPKSNPLARPQRFDVVTGVSSGALIAPFAWLGDADADQRVVDLYRNPQPDWVKERWPLYFLPNHISFAEVPGLERAVKETYSREMMTRISDKAETGRLLFVNTTNLDDGSPRVFYLVPEAQRALQTGDLSRFHKILLASAGIPGAFPYREIDGAMYVDGAVSANMIFGGRLPEERRLVGLWARLYPDTPMPKLRYWVIFNNQLHPPPEVVPARWPSIILRSVDVASRTTSLNALRQLFMLAEIARLHHNADVEVRFIAVPDDWRPPKPGTFIKETMNNLADLGEKMGADPNSWITEPPTQ
ncbi:MAG TPA: patatin-like phospholipase family protein [Tepidisphaeraceae bacterium]